MKKCFILSLCLLVAYGCVKNPNMQPDEETSFNSFDFSTIQEVTLQVDYAFDASIPFEVYSSDPLIYGANNTFRFDEDMKPIAVGWTDVSGSYEGHITLPAYLDKVYVVTSAFFVPTIMEASVEGGLVSAVAETCNASVNTKAEDGTGIDNFAGHRSIENWKCWLGTVNEVSGRPDYILGQGAYLTIDAGTATQLYDVLSQSINIGGSCPDEYRTDVDMYVSKDADIVMTMLGGNTCWNNSIGYYYYTEGNAPRSISEANVIAMFPNAQDGFWQVGEAVNPGINRGDAVKLIYYPNIASGSKEGATGVFPAGTYIGFVLATNGWDKDGVSGDVYGDHKNYYSCSTKGLSNRGYNNIDVHTAIFRYGENVLVSFEDYLDDDNFSDVIFTMTSNPVNAVNNIPAVYPVQKEMRQYDKGLYLFEDVWPYKGDYDMNDVMVQFELETQKYRYGRGTRIGKQCISLTSYSNYAGNVDDGLAVSISNLDGDIARLNGYVKNPGSDRRIAANFTVDEDNTIRFTDNFKENLGATYYLDVTYDDNNLPSETPYFKVFVYRRLGDVEIHIPMEAPTANANWEYFGSGDDKSDVLEGVYYVSEGQYPFALFLDDAYLEENDPMLDSKNESVRIDVLYPEFGAWVSSDGKKNKDWYLHL